MEKKYRYLFFWYLYKHFNLDKFERNLEEFGIKSIKDQKNMTDSQKECLNISKYFYILNDVDISILDSEEKRFLSDFPVEQINNLPSNVIEFLGKFMRNTYLNCLIPETRETYLYYGPPGFEYLAPSDAIVIGFKYDEFGFDNGRKVTEKKHDDNEEMIVNLLNDLQNMINKEIKLAIIKYNEFSKNHLGINR